MKKTVYFLIAVVSLAVPVFAEDSPQVAYLQYWIDGNHAACAVSSVMEFDIDCAALSPGLHTLHYRISDIAGKYSPLYEHGFLKLPSATSASKVDNLQYWWDDMHQNAVTVPYTAEEFVLSTDALPYGLHSLKYRVKDDAGRWSDCRSHYFYKGNAEDAAMIVCWTYWWNDLADKAVTRVLEESAVSFVLDEELTVPQEARTNYAGHYTATLNIIVTDSRGRSAFLRSNVEYPDSDAPVTDIDADSYVASSSVTLSWAESSGDQMGDYNVYFSQDGGPFQLWLPDTKKTSAVFNGKRGSCYVFTVTGRDSFGNRETYDESKCVSVTFE